MTKNVEKILKEGVMYTYGRDKQGCPIIIIDLNKANFIKYEIEDFYSAINTLINFVIDRLFIPGSIEKYVFLILATDLNIRNISMDSITRAINDLSVIYAGNLKKMFIFDNGNTTKLVYSTIKPFISAGTQKKI